MEQKKILVWFRNDLRIHDHQPLFEASKKGDCIVPVFCIDTRWLEKTKYGTNKMGNLRWKFLLESLVDLKNKFKNKSADLLIVLGKPEDVIPEIAFKYKVSSVVAYKEVATEEVILSDLLEANLWKHKIPLTLYLGNTLHNKEDLPFPIKDIPDVFSNFRKRVERDSYIRVMFEEPMKLSIPTDLEKSNLPTLIELGVEFKKQDARTAILYKGGETEALNQLHYYLWESDLLKKYKETRNNLIGRDYSSKLSAALSLGCISPRKIYWEIKKYENERGENESTYWLIFELLWRDYFRFMFKKYGSKLFQIDGIQTPKLRIPNPNELEWFERWKDGKTGIPFIDANMLELNSTGFMSNRGRQNVASFLIHDLNISWVKGAAYFEEKLVDYNPASNWGNWAYLAGVGNDAREIRKFNILKQAYDYDGKGEYVKMWLPFLKSLPSNCVHQPYLLSLEEQLKYGINLEMDYTMPIVNYEKFKL